MKPLKIMTIFGTRPEAIKMAPLVKAMEKVDLIQPFVCVTAQHREMLDMVLELFEIQPHYDLDIMKHGQTITEITTRVLQGLEKVIAEIKPDMILVHGDTTTTFVAALAGFYQQIKIGHVEAGLRSGNIYSPYPEEMNRRLTSSLANLHFAPTKGNYQNLVDEGVSPDNILITGNTVIDALFYVVKDDYHFENDILNNIDYENKKVIVMTCHRRENWGKPMEDIFEAVKEVAYKYQNVEVIFPVHMNPAIRQLARNIMGGNKNIKLIEPLDYQPFANLMSKAYMILTDSGGIQEEGPAFGKPILVTRNETERPEAVEAGTVKIVGTNKDTIVRETSILIEDLKAYEPMANAINPYGDGESSKRIIDGILKYFGRIQK